MAYPGGAPGVPPWSPGRICVNPERQNEIVQVPPVANPMRERDRQDHETIPHEVFHIIEFGRVPLGKSLLDGAFWLEGTAQWAERQFELLRGYDDPTGANEWAWNMDRYLRQPNVSLSDSDGFREYAAGSLVAWFLEGAYHNPSLPPGDVIQETYTRWKDSLPFYSAKDAIIDTVSAHGTDIGAIWLDYAQQAYEMTVAPVNTSAWMASLGQASAGAPAGVPAPGNPTGSDAMGKARPARSNVTLALGDWWSPAKSEELGQLGMSYTDLVLSGASEGTVEVRVDLPEGVAARIVAYHADAANGPTSTVCGSAVDLVEPGTRVASVAVTPQCSYATLMLVRTSPQPVQPFWEPRPTAAWSARFSIGGIVDTFSRPDREGWGVSDSGDTWTEGAGPQGHAVIANGTGRLDSYGDNGYLQIGLTRDLPLPLDATLDVSRANGGPAGITLDMPAQRIVASWQQEGPGHASLHLAIVEYGTGGGQVEAVGPTMDVDIGAPEPQTVRLHVDADKAVLTMAGEKVTAERRDATGGSISPLAFPDRFSLWGYTGGGGPLLVVDNLYINWGY